MPTPSLPVDFAHFLTELSTHNDRHWFKRKDFGMKLALDERQLTKPKLAGEIVDGFAVVAPFLEFLTNAIGLPF